MIMAKKQMLTSFLDDMETATVQEHDRAEQTATTGKNTTRATALVSMTVDEKEDMTAWAKEHGMSLSSLFRIAVKEYRENHN